MTRLEQIRMLAERCDYNQADVPFLLDLYAQKERQINDINQIIYHTHGLTASEWQARIKNVLAGRRPTDDGEKKDD